MNPRVVAIGGSDPSCGAGVQADLFALLRFGVSPATVITSVTAQNSLGVTSARPLPAEWVTEQLRSVWEDGAPAVAKVGLIGSAEVAQAVADFLRENPVPLVVDPVIAASDGTPFLDGEAIRVLRQELFPLALLVTPNFAEAQILVGGDSPPLAPEEGTTSPLFLPSEGGGKEQALPLPLGEGRGEGRGAEGAGALGPSVQALARAVRRLGPRWVLITGGDALQSIWAESVETPRDRVGKTDIVASSVVSDGADSWEGKATDWLTDGEHDWSFSAPRRPYEVRGTGCLLASAIAAQLAHGCEVPQAVGEAKHWVGQVIDQAQQIGKGRRQAVLSLRE